MDDGGGGFVDEDMDTQPSTTLPASTPTPTVERIPLRLISQLLGALSLPSDEDVLEVFRASASGWGEGGGEGIARKDFRAVCAALMEPDGAADAVLSSDEDSADAFAPSDESFSDVEDEDDDYGDVTGKGKTPKSTRKTRLQVAAAPKLTTRQKEQARIIWDMFKPGQEGRGTHILGRDEVKHWVRELGEMWTEEEVGHLRSLRQDNN